jgi:hypothetical protein
VTHCQLCSARFGVIIKFGVNNEDFKLLTTNLRQCKCMMETLTILFENELKKLFSHKDTVIGEKLHTNDCWLHELIS